MDWLVKLAQTPPYNISDKHNRAKALGMQLMDLAFFQYSRHIYNRYDGFKSELVKPGEGTTEGAQGAGVYGHILGMSGAYLSGVMSGGRIAGWFSAGYDHLQNSVIGQKTGIGTAQAPAEAAGNVAGGRAGRHIWDFLRDKITADKLNDKLSSDLCQ